MPLTIDLHSGQNGHFFLRSGWSYPEVHGTWTDGPMAVIHIPISVWSAGYNAEIVLLAHPNPHLDRAPLVEIHAGELILASQIINDWDTVKFDIPSSAYCDQDYIEISLICLDAVAPNTIGLGTDGRRLGFLVSHINIYERPEQEKIEQILIINKIYELKTQNPRVAAVTMVYNENLLIPIWLRHYARHVGIENCFIVDHGSNDGCTDSLHGVNVIRMPRTPYDPAAQSRFNSRFCSGLLSFHDWVIYSDVDELMMPDPKIAASLVEYCARPLPEIISAIGVNLVHRPAVEKPLDLGRPISEQRRYGHFSSGMCKPNLISRPIVWSPGSHSANCPTVFDHLYMFHLHHVDLTLALDRLQRTRTMAWADDRASSHARVDNSVMNEHYRSYDSMHCVNCLDFDPTSEPILSYIQRVIASRKGRETSVFKTSLEIWGSELWQLPDRFVGTF